MFHLDLKQAESAIAAGRLDEAFSLLTSSSARGHREGQRRVDELIEAFVKRGTVHFAEGRLDDAMHDARAAASLGGRQVRIARLLDSISQAKQQRHDGEKAVWQQRSAKVTSSAGHQIQKVTGIQKVIGGAGEVLCVDGLGSLLMLRSDHVSIGPASTSCRHDVVVLDQTLQSPLMIRRDADDYFAESDSDFLVAGKPTSRRLLQDRDTLSIGSRGRLKFKRGVAASGTAVLEVTGVKLQQRDIRNVVLMSDSLLIGGSGSHFKLAESSVPIILQPAKDGFSIHAKGSFDQQALRPNESVVVNDIRFALSPNTHPRSSA